MSAELMHAAEVLLLRDRYPSYASASPEARLLRAYESLVQQVAELTQSADYWVKLETKRDGQRKEAEIALATERAAREAAEKEMHTAHVQTERVLRGRDTALARVRELERDAEGERAALRGTVMRAGAAESTLASARAIALKHRREASHYTTLKYREGVEAMGFRALDELLHAPERLLSSHPAAAPVAKQRRVYTAQDAGRIMAAAPVATPLTGEQLAERYGFKPHGQLPDAVVAPCAGCAELRKRLNDVSESHNGWVDKVEQVEGELRSARAKYDRITALERAIDAAVAELERMTADLNYPSYVLGVPKSVLAALRAARKVGGA